jgi:putative peptidoglycan lipid II flippase
MTVPTGSSAQNRMVTASLVGSVWTLISRATGLLRLVVVGAVLGPTQFANLYQTTNQLPNVAFDLLAGFLLGSLVVPALVRHLDLGDTAATERLASGFMTVILLAGMVVVVVGVALGPVVIDLITIAAPTDGSQLNDRLAWLLFALLLLQLPLYAVAGMGGVVQNARGRYAIAAGAPALENVGIIVTLLAFSAVLPSAGGQVGTLEIILLGCGTTAAVALHAGLQWVGAQRQGVRLGLRNCWQDPEVGLLVRLAVPSLGYTSLTVARYTALLLVAAAVSGGVVAFNLAFAFYLLPVALAARPVAQAALPEFSRAFHRSDNVEFSAALGRALRLALFLTVPAAAGYLLVSGPLSGAVAFGGMATPEGRALVRACLLGISLGLVGDAVIEVCTRAAYARRDARLPLLAQAIRSGLGIAGMLAALAMLHGSELLFGIGLSVAVSDLVAAVFIYNALRQRLLPHPPSVSRALAGILVAALAMTAILVPLQVALPNSVDQLACIGIVLASAVVGAVIYLAVQHLLGSPELRALRAAVRGGRDASHES